MRNRLKLAIGVGILLGSSVLTASGAGAARERIQSKQLQAFVEALRLAAPPQRPNDGMYSDWQVLPGIIPNWTKQCVGKAMSPAAFDADRAAARETVSCIAGRELDRRLRSTGDSKLAVRQAACWWMTGKDNGCETGATAEYVRRVEKFYRQQL
ncbi:hypothetical protein V0288_25060 [Pannus brasiliensis CCIBt3594]|uniref:Lysozyme inhibitor LprI N-terminal domain-containing protein n=1 Tax=Pannus brasiliensis CCIBt3594 TaxID=1427578 RepID=A0AAW9QRI8_9CHRO